MNTLLWVLAGLLAYTAVAAWLRSAGYLPDSVRLQGPLMTLHTKRGRAFLNWLAGPRRFWRAWANVGLGVALVLMVGIFFQLLLVGLSILREPPEPTVVNQPESFLVIPGVNPFLPASVAPEIVLGLLIGLVVHEGGHGLLCRVEDIDIESMGLVFLAIIPVGAFVEPDEKSQRAADRGGRSRMFAAGVTNNFAVTILAFALLFGPVVASVGVAPGLAVAGSYAGSPADQVGIQQGDRVVALDGTRIDGQSDFDAVLLNTTDPTVEATVDSGDGERTVTVQRRLVVSGAVEGNYANLSLQPDEDPINVTAVNGTEVRTRAGFREALGDRSTVRLSTSRGERVVPVGAFITEAVGGEPLNASLGPDAPRTGFLVTEIGGEQISSSTELSRTLDGYAEGDTVGIELYYDGAYHTVDVTLDADPDGDGGYLGVRIFPGTSGLLFSDFGVQSYPAGTYLELLGGEGGEDAISPDDLPGLPPEPLSLAYLSLVLPLASFVLGIPNFPGFTDAVTNFYVVTGPLEPLGGGVFLLANALFWTAWINLQLGLFNCVPGYPLDGGRLLRMAAEGVVSRLPIEDRHTAVRSVTTSVGLTMLAALLLTVFGAQLL
jgi:membrane-associated protease RseP (regulator of RpoE activity)